MMEFNRNHFKEFAVWNEMTTKKNCTTDHSEIVANHYYPHIKHAYSFRNIPYSHLDEYDQIGSLRDPKIKHLNYLQFNDKDGEYWHPDAKIATNFYPYHECNVYRCKKCRKLFLVYIEESGHGAQLRMRNVKFEFIIEEPGNVTLQIPQEKLCVLREAGGFSESTFNAHLRQNENLQRIPTDFHQDQIIVYANSPGHFTVVASRQFVYDLIDKLEANSA